MLRFTRSRRVRSDPVRGVGTVPRLERPRSRISCGRAARAGSVVVPGSRCVDGRSGSCRGVRLALAGPSGCSARRHGPKVPRRTTGISPEMPAARQTDGTFGVARRRLSEVGRGVVEGFARAPSRSRSTVDALAESIRSVVQSPSRRGRARSSRPHGWLACGRSAGARPRPDGGRRHACDRAAGRRRGRMRRSRDPGCRSRSRRRAKAGGGCERANFPF